jgi:hypothetical protein
MLRRVFFYRLAFEVWHFDILSFVKINNLTILMITVLIIYLSLGALLLIELCMCLPLGALQLAILGFACIEAKVSHYNLSANC